MLFSGGININKQTIFAGVATALITPFDKANGVDYQCLKRLIEFQIANNTQAIVICGTTGEAPTISVKEHKKIIDFSVQTARGRIKIIAGCGSNDTRHAVMMSRYAERAGAYGLLSISPYYNRPCEDGLKKHYLEIADSVSLPIILYNVPTRTGVDMSVNLYKSLSSHPNIVGIKEASDSFSKCTRIFEAVGDYLDIYAGNDQSFLGYLALGGKGVISVASNLVPSKMMDIYRYYTSGKKHLAERAFMRILPFINALTKRVNPVMIKYAMHKAKMCDNRLRSPLLAVKEGDTEAEIIKKALMGDYAYEG